MGDVRDWDQFIRGRWRWTAHGYERGFPRGSQFSDIDAATEFDGHRLKIESKFWDGIGSPPGIDTGQYRLLQDEAERDNTTVLVVYGCASCNNPLAVRDMGTLVLQDFRDMELECRRKELKKRIDEAMGLRP